jgi:hypothetical protein
MLNNALPASLAISIPLAAFAAACGTTTTDDGIDPPGDNARVRLVHASPGAPAVDIHVKGSTAPLVTNLSYGMVTDFITVPAGTYNLQVRPTGRLDPVLYETGDITLEIDAEITGIATGFVDSTSPSDAFRVLALTNAFEAAGSDVRVRIVHAAPDAPTVGIDVGNDDPREPEIRDLARFADSGGAGVALPAGQALAVGITAGGARVTQFTAPPLPAGAELLVLAIGRLAQAPDADDGFALMAIGPDGLVGVIPQDPSIYALHASPDAPRVDIRAGADGPLAIGNLGYGELARAQVSPGDVALAFYGAGGSGTPAATANVTGLEAGKSYLAIAAGMLTPGHGEQAFGLIALADDMLRTTVDARARVVHASPDAPAVDVGTVTGNYVDQPALVQNLRFGEATADDGLALPAASLTVGVAQAGLPQAVAKFGLTTEHGLRAFAVAAGALSPNEGEQPFGLMIVDASVTPWQVAMLSPQ